MCPHIVRQIPLSERLRRIPARSRIPHPLSVIDIRLLTGHHDRDDQDDDLLHVGYLIGFARQLSGYGLGSRNRSFIRGCGPMVARAPRKRKAAQLSGTQGRLQILRACAL